MIRDLDVTCEHLPDADCPYRDLRAFQEQDAPVLFGRDAFTRELVEAVDQHPFVAVVGASGSGKSSVVQVGLIPALRRRGGWAGASGGPDGLPEVAWRAITAGEAELEIEARGHLRRWRGRPRFPVDPVPMAR